jgi:N-acetylmuramoyl-L-alanine amidase
MKMKKVNLILWIAVVFLLSISSQSFSQHNYVCIDPGHGGMESGNIGRVYGLLEKDADLGVGLA